MNFETPQSPDQEGAPNSPDRPAMDRSLEAMEAADALVAEHELLKNNPRVKFIAENNYVTDDGRELDPGTFIAKMVTYLESQQGATITEAEVSAAAEAAVEPEGIDGTAESDGLEDKPTVH